MCDDERILRIVGSNLVPGRVEVYNMQCLRCPYKLEFTQGIVFNPRFVQSKEKKT